MFQRSNAIPWIVTHHPKVWSNTIPRMVTHYPKDGHPPIIEWSTSIRGIVITFSRKVTHHFQDGPLDLECDPSAAQLVNSIMKHMENSDIKLMKNLSQQLHCNDMIVIMRDNKNQSVTKKEIQTCKVRFKIPNNCQCKQKNLFAQTYLESLR